MAIDFKDTRFCKSLETTVEDVIGAWKGMSDERQYWLMPVWVICSPLTIPIAFLDNYSYRRYKKE